MNKSQALFFTEAGRKKMHKPPADNCSASDEHGHLEKNKTIGLDIL